MIITRVWVILNLTQISGLVADFTPNSRDNEKSYLNLNHRSLSLLNRSQFRVPNSDRLQGNFLWKFWFDYENASKKRSLKLSYELHELSQLENEFKSDYEKLSEQCEIFAKEVLDRVKK